MKAAEDIIIRPVITEESMAEVAERKYAFKVAPDATKIDVARACEKLFGIKVKKVNTMNVKGHKRTYGRYTGYKPNWKKAIVTITEDSKTIEFFDGMY